MIFSVLFLSYTHNLSLSNYLRFDKHLNVNDTVLINAIDSLMTVNLINSTGVSIRRTLNGDSTTDLHNPHDIKYIDFGVYSGSLSFLANSETDLVFDAFIFPYECNTARIVTNKLPFLFDLTRKNTNEYFQIKNDQTFCIWHTFEGEKNIKISMSTEENIDTFKQMKEGTDILTLSGEKEVSLSIKGTEYWFKWKSDYDRESNFISMHVTSNTESNESSQSYLFSVSKNYTIPTVVYKTDLDDSSDSSARSSNFLIIIIVSCIVFVMLVSVIVVIWVFFRNHRSNAQIKSFEMQADRQELLDDFTLCNTSEILPQPVSYKE